MQASPKNFNSGLSIAEHKSKYYENQTISVTIDFWWHWHFSKYLLSCSTEHHTGLDQHEILGF